MEQWKEESRLYVWRRNRGNEQTDIRQGVLKGGTHRALEERLAKISGRTKGLATRVPWEGSTVPPLDISIFVLLFLNPLRVQERSYCQSCFTLQSGEEAAQALRAAVLASCIPPTPTPVRNFQ